MGYHASSPRPSLRLKDAAVYLAAGCHASSPRSSLILKDAVVYPVAVGPVVVWSLTAVAHHLGGAAEVGGVRRHVTLTQHSAEPIAGRTEGGLEG